MLRQKWMMASSKDKKLKLNAILSAKKKILHEENLQLMGFIFLNIFSGFHSCSLRLYEQKNNNKKCKY